ncbi:hypothetical protein BDN72DRAFT_877598 [Pluteus cervinus]|uniref:Uncharacterized protein n=1 Tax=Pluteus cervinus TaxID=181527 RepID=A0ACD3AZK7_9AGAR|nr:hypothetical protein BDN72DRAFT_877598 [Pluteus cervinus]
MTRAKPYRRMEVAVACYSFPWKRCIPRDQNVERRQNKIDPERKNAGEIAAYTQALHLMTAGGRMGVPRPTEVVIFGSFRIEKGLYRIASMLCRVQTKHKEVAFLGERWCFKISVRHGNEWVNRILKVKGQGIQLQSIRGEFEVRFVSTLWVNDQKDLSHVPWLEMDEKIRIKSMYWLIGVKDRYEVTANQKLKKDGGIKLNKERCRMMVYRKETRCKTKSFGLGNFETPPQHVQGKGKDPDNHEFRPSYDGTPHQTWSRRLQHLVMQNVADLETPKGAQVQYGFQKIGSGRVKCIESPMISLLRKIAPFTEPLKRSMWACFHQSQLGLE